MYCMKYLNFTTGLGTSVGVQKKQTPTKDGRVKSKYCGDVFSAVDANICM